MTINYRLLPVIHRAGGVFKFPFYFELWHKVWMTPDIASFPILEPANTQNSDTRIAQEMPHNFEAEQGLLGMLLIDNNHLERVSDFLRPQHFSHPSHQNIYATIEKMIERGVEISSRQFESPPGLIRVQLGNVLR